MNHHHDTNPDIPSDTHPHNEPKEWMPPQYHIIGDVYVDILCYMPAVVTTTVTHPTPSVLQLDGTDTTLTQPITIMAGGSTINTATYLQYLQRVASTSSPPSSSTLDITVYTVFNPNDYYGSILIQHSNQHNITLQNGYTTGNSNDKSNDPSQPHQSTPHCMVMISSTTTTTSVSSERTFLTHRGCATNNMYIHDLFPSFLSPPSPQSATTNGTRSAAMCPIHYHIAGYFCTPEFWNVHTESSTNLLQLSSFVKNIFTNPPVRSNENVWSHSNGTNTTSSTAFRAPIILSLVTQYDATQQWDITNLKAILPYMHICIMNELEAHQIYERNYQGVDTDRGLEDIVVQSDEVDPLLLNMISFFTEFNPSTIYVVTQGVKGAIAFRNKVIIARVYGTVNVASIIPSNSGCVNGDLRNDAIIDPTGAGDAFCAGFFHSLWKSIQCDNTGPVENDWCSSTFDSVYRPSEYYWSRASTIQDALLYGCTTGTCSIMQRGGSTIPTSDPKLVQLVHDQYKQLRPSKVATHDHSS